MTGTSAVAMAGFPPSPETRIGPDNWNRLPWLRWSQRNRDRMLPSTSVWRGGGAVWNLPSSPQDLGALPTPAGALDAALDELQVNGFLVLQRGRILFETYRHGLRPEDRHMLASVTKSVVGLLATMLVQAGSLDLTRTASAYVPETRDAPIGSATLQQLLDMQAGIRRPDMSHRDGSIGGHDGGLYEALGLLPAVPGGPRNLAEMVLQRPADGPHGARMFYDNAQTELVAWAMRRATGLGTAELMHELLWSALGAERDAFFVLDSQAMECASGGLAMTLRDLARLGELIRTGGTLQGQVVIPEQVLAVLQAGGEPAKFAATSYASWLPGGSYRNSWYVGHEAPKTIMANGRYGQRLWIFPGPELVVAQLSSIPGPSPQPENIPLAQIAQAIAQALS